MTEWAREVAPFAVTAFYLGLAVVILRTRPRRRPNLALAGYCLSFSALFGWGITVRLSGPGEDLSRVGTSALLNAVYLFLFLLALWLPRPHPGPGPFRRPAAFAAAFSTLVVGISAAIGWSAVGPGNPYPDPWREVYVLAGAFQDGTVWFLLALLAMRFAFVPPGHARDRRQAALLTLAVSFFTAVYAGEGLAHLGEFDVAHRLFLLGLFVALAGVWLAAGHRSGPDAPLARRVAWVLLAVPLVSALASIPFGIYGYHARFFQGLSAILLTYAILRHQLLGLDTKVKWTLKQSTVAAAFIGVFFVVSESASSFLATEGGLGMYLGIAAAGLLVFMLAPLQRAAEKVASAAMPGVKGVGEMTRDERVDVYREAAATAWRDGMVDRSERALLDALRAKLGLPAEVTAAIEGKAAREDAP